MIGPQLGSIILVLEMPLPPSITWKLFVAVVLVGGILLSACVRAPRRRLSRAEPHRLVLGGLCLYAVGVGASLTHHALLAAVVYASGISACALAAWLSRGSGPEDPPDDDDGPLDREPPPDPDGLPEFDWVAFERQFRAYSAARRAPVGAGR